MFNEFVMYMDKNITQSKDKSLVQPKPVYFNSKNILKRGIIWEIVQNPQVEETTA